MRNFLAKMRNGFARMMYGRYGGDALGRFLLILGMVLLIAGMILSAISSTGTAIAGSILYILSWIVIFWQLMRMLSRKIPKRRLENQWYLTKTAALRSRFAHAKDKNYRYYRCPKCGVTTRVPRGKGKIRITCPRCGESFIKNT